MSQDNLRQQVYFLKRMVSYGEIAKSIKVAPTSFYSWLEGNYNLKDETAERLQEYITNLLLDKTPGGKKQKTVRNLINLLGQYHFDDNEVLAELSQYDSNERYYITNTGKCFSLCGQDWIMKKPQLNKEDGYLYVDIYEDGKKTRKKIHQLVVEAFLPSMVFDGMEIHHLDQNKENNNLENLLPLTKEQHATIHKYLRKWQNVMEVSESEQS